MSNHYEDTIWKQITTATADIWTVFLLWAIITKIQSESKSQLHLTLTVPHTRCEQSLRRYNLKANHNPPEGRNNYMRVVSNHYEDTIWKQITTLRLNAKPSTTLWAIITKIQSESKSQRVATCRVVRVCCEQSLRRYNLKANHNGNSSLVFVQWLWAIITKIQSESKSQQ